MLIKKRHYRPIPKAAEIFTRDGKTLARWTTSKGRRITRPLNARGDRLVTESRCWYVRLKDADGNWRERKAFTDKSASTALEAQLLTKIERGQVGLVDPLEEQSKRPLKEHLFDFQGHLEDKGNSIEHVELTAQRCQTVFDGIKATVIGDITTGRVEAYLAELRRDGRSMSTSNHYFRAVRNFCRWLVRDRRAMENAVVGLSALKLTEQDKKHRRRPLTDDEFNAVIQAARSSTTVFRGLAGESRAMLYVVASNTGLRTSELASLVPESFDLESNVPTVHCLGAYTKNGQEAAIPLRADLTGMLKIWLADKPEGQRVWPGTWANKTSAKMFRIDLSAARGVWLGEVDGEQARKKRERSSFLKYCDSSGRYADFHSLRHRFISNLARAGVHPKNAQVLARHSRIALTMDHYTHTVLGDLANDVANLPALPAASAVAAEQVEALAATGTDDAHGKRRTKRRFFSDSPCTDRAIPGTEWQDQAAAGGDHGTAPKPLQTVQIDKTCQRVASLVTNEADGIRTRNHRIDSPVL